MACCLTAIAWTNIDLSSVRSFWHSLEGVFTGSSLHLHLMSKGPHRSFLTGLTNFRSPLTVSWADFALKSTIFRRLYSTCRGTASLASSTGRINFHPGYMSMRLSARRRSSLPNTWGWNKELVIFINTLRKKKISVMLQTIFSMQFRQWKCILIKTSLTCVPKGHLTINQHWFMSWLSVEQATWHNLNQWWPSTNNAFLSYTVSLRYTVKCLYNSFPFIITILHAITVAEGDSEFRITTRHPISRPHGRDMGCLFWGLWRKMTTL